MMWTCRLVDKPAPDAEPRVGDMWREDDLQRHPLAPEHLGRQQLVVRLPGPIDFAVYGPTWGADGPGPSGWTVTGEPPRITIMPSINAFAIYHGYVREGVITDDLDGRRFNEDGRRIRG